MRCRAQVSILCTGRGGAGLSRCRLQGPIPYIGRGSMGGLSRCRAQGLIPCTGRGGAGSLPVETGPCKASLGALSSPVT